MDMRKSRRVSSRSTRLDLYFVLRRVPELAVSSELLDPLLGYVQSDSYLGRKPLGSEDLLVKSYP